MNTKKIFLSAVFLLSVGLVFTQNAPREVNNFNFGWRFHFNDAGSDVSHSVSTVDFDDTAWRDIDLPHDFQINQEWDSNADGLRGFKTMSEGWYRKVFKADPAWKGKRILLDFEGIMLTGDAWFNGVKVGGTNYGYLGFEAEITNLVSYEVENVVAVYASTKGGSRWYTGGGLYRDVHLIVKDSISVARHGVYITTPEISANHAQVSVQVEIEGFRAKDIDLEIAAKIFSPDGKQVAETKTFAPKKSKKSADEVSLPAVNIAAPQLWSCETPNLYTAEITLSLDGKMMDQITETFGIRSIDFSSEFGFKLNGEKVFLKGVSNHHDLGAVGAAAHEFAIERLFKKLKEFGYNHVRTSHNPYSKSFLKLADKYGILIVDELYDKWGQHWWVGVERVKWTEEVFENIPEWIKRDRNHPSVVMWSLGNELQVQEDLAGFLTSDWGVTTYRMLDVLTKRYDATRPTTVAMFPARAGALTWWDEAYKDVVVPPELAVATEIASFNYEYRTFGDYMKSHPDMIFYQSEATTGELLQPFFGMDHRKTVGLAYWGAVEYWGESVGWPKKGWDFSFFNHALEPFPQAYLMKIAFSEEPLVCIGVVDSEAETIEWNDVIVGRMPISSHWNRKAGSKQNLFTYTNAEEVELFVNGKSFGVQKNIFDQSVFSLDHTDLSLANLILVGDKIERRNIIFWQNVPYANGGNIVAIARNKGKEVARHRLETTGKATALKIEMENQQWKADGMDLQYVKIYAIDSKGRIVPTSDGEVTFEVSGAARLIAVDNGNHSSHELFDGNKRMLHNGFAMAILRSTMQAGTVTIRAGVKGLKSAEKTMSTNHKE